MKNKLLETGMFKKQNSTTAGFTLIEIMVVIFIFMTIMMVVVINTNFAYTDDKKVESFSDNLLTKIKLARQTAIFAHAPLSLFVEGNEFGFKKFQKVQNKYEWVWLDKDPLLKKQRVDKDIILKQTFAIEFYPNGRFTPFTLTISNNKQDITYIIAGNTTGELELIKK